MKEQIKWERSGLAYALKIMTKTPNLAANYTELAKEVKMRKCIPMPMSMTKDEITDIFEECIEKILSTYPVVICKVLHDEFGFGGERLTKFMQMFRESVYSLHNVDTFGDSYCTFSEYADEFIKKYKKYGLEYNMERIYMIDNEYEEKKDRRIDKEAVLDWLYEHGHVEAAVDLQAFLGIES